MTGTPKFKIAHTNINVQNLERSVAFYEKALGLREARRHVNEENRFTLVYMQDEAGLHEIELTYLEDHKDEPYDLGENEWHICFRADDFDAAYKLHKEMDCIIFENTAMGLYFIEDPDGYWLEITPTRDVTSRDKKSESKESDKKAVVLAAGKGTRLQSEAFNAPKVLRQANDKPLLGYVLDNLSFIPKKDVVLVVGYMGEDVQAYAGDEYSFVWQHEQLGTGHAVQMAKDELEGFDGPVLVCYGDMPLIRQDTFEGMFRAHEENGNDCTVLAYVTERKLPYGRIIRDENGDFKEVVEEVDCTPEQLKIKELNAGVYVFGGKQLQDALGRLENDNVQNEYYLTDVPALILKDGGKVGLHETTGEAEGVGVNTEDDLQQVEDLLREDT